MPLEDLEQPSNCHKSKSHEWARSCSGVALSPRLCSLCCLALQPTGALLAGGDPSDSAGGNGRQAADDCVL